MPFLTQGKTNWKYILIVVILAVVVGGGILGWIKRQEVSLGESPEIKKPEITWVVYDSSAQSLFDWEKYILKYPENWDYKEERIPSSRKLGALKTTFKDEKDQLKLSVIAGGDKSIYSSAQYISEIELFNNIFYKYRDNNTGKIYYIYETGREEEIKLGMESEVILQFNKVEENIMEEILKTFSLKRAVEDKTANWKTYINEKYGFTMRYPERSDIDLITTVDGVREFLFGSVDCKYEGKEATVLGTIRFLPKIEGMIPNIERIPGAPHTAVRKPTKEECDELASRYIISGRFCTNKNLTKYQAYCEGGSETSDYHRYDVFLVCDGESFKGKEGRIRCNQIFNQILSTFRFIETLSGETKAILVYLTDNKYDGNLGGRQGADAKCNPPSGLECKTGTVHALLTVDKNDSIINMADNYNLDKELTIYWFNKETKKITILAYNWSKMLNEDIINGQGEGTGNYDFCWTGDKGDTGYLSTCSGWTKNGNDERPESGNFGIFAGTEKEKILWLSASGWAGITNSRLCSNEWYLRCLCEGTVMD